MGDSVKSSTIPPPKIIIDDKMFTREFLSPIEEYNETFGYGDAVVELETFGYTTSWDKWEQQISEVKPDALCAYAKDKKSYALHESIIVAGKVFVMREAVMFSAMTGVMIYVEKLFVLYQIYEGVSPLDQKTVRFFVRGAMKEDGVVPVYGGNA